MHESSESKRGGKGNGGIGGVDSNVPTFPLVTYSFSQGIGIVSRNSTLIACCEDCCCCKTNSNKLEIFASINFSPVIRLYIKGGGTNNLNKELNSFFISIEFRVNLSQAWPKSCKML